MIQLSKETKIKLLQAIKTGQFDGDDFPELVTELKRIEIELINDRSQVRDYSHENKINSAAEN